MQLERFHPRSQLVVEATHIEKPRFPVIEAHSHLGEPFGGGWENRPFEELLERLDEARVVHLVDLDGGWGEDILSSHLDAFKAKAPERFSVFGGVDWSKWTEKGEAFPEWAAGRLPIQKKRGAAGLKIWKPLGLTVRDHQDQLAKVDDPRLDPIWQTAGELGLPVLIHVGDSRGLLRPGGRDQRTVGGAPTAPRVGLDEPRRSRHSLEIMNGLARVLARHPRTTFIGAHVGGYVENLGVGERPARPMPRTSTWTSPIASRSWAASHGQRGASFFATPTASSSAPTWGQTPRCRASTTDSSRPRMSTSIRIPVAYPRQGRWHIYGLDLPEEVLAKVYLKNASKIPRSGG